MTPGAQRELFSLELSVQVIATKGEGHAPPPPPPRQVHGILAAFLPTDNLIFSLHGATRPPGLLLFFSCSQLPPLHSCPPRGAACISDPLASSCPPHTCLATMRWHLATCAARWAHAAVLALTQWASSDSLVVWCEDVRMAASFSSGAHPRASCRQVVKRLSRVSTQARVRRVTQDFLHLCCLWFAFVTRLSSPCGEASR